MKVHRLNWYTHYESRTRIRYSATALQNHLEITYE
jgi:hypothetical protein